MRKFFIITGVGVLSLLSLWVLVMVFSRPGEYVKVSYDDLENWSSDNQAQALAAFKKSCSVFLSEAATKKIPPQQLGGIAADWQPSCRAAKNLNNPTDDRSRRFFERQFTVLSYSTDTQGLFTGYFAPEYSGSDTATEVYSYPLYGVPENLRILDLGRFSSALQGKTIIGEVKAGEFVPYKDRENIDRGALKGQKLELVWLKSQTDVFFMHIQGSGVIRYENGDRKTFGYAGKNGKAYHAIGKFLIDAGEISAPDMSMQAIRSWIAANQLQARALMWKNPSYVFFRALDTEIPVGSLNVELTAGRSLAIDRTYVPMGMPLWLDLQPSNEAADPIRRLVIAQDTGGAIKGRVRADIYWGIGEDAGLMAGSMKDRGRFYFLLPKILAERLLSEKKAVP
ncbi:MAG: murein transglycosylase [Alphaproteobacteria bacterium]|nr:MAG: murein transglycosylase [Alphaproteobacteria bacterium]